MSDKRNYNLGSGLNTVGMIAMLLLVIFLLQVCGRHLEFVNTATEGLDAVEMKASNGLENDAPRGLLKRVVARKGYEMRLYDGTGYNVLRYVRKGRVIGLVYWREDHKPMRGTKMLVESVITDELAKLDPTLREVVRQANLNK